MRVVAQPGLLVSKRGLCLIVRTKPAGKAWLAENLETGQVPLGIDSVRE
jgi:hypothetical protein